MAQLLLPFLTGPLPQPAAAEAADAAHLDAPGPARSGLSLAGPSGRAAELPRTPPAAGPPAPRGDLFHGPAEALAERIGRWLEEPVEVELTDNAWTMVSYKRVAGRLRFRLHHMFCEAEERVARALARFTRRARRQHGRTIDRFIQANRALIRSAPARSDGRLESRGRVHQLDEILASLNARHFANRVDARIGWGRRAPGRRRRSIKMGVYLHDQRLIRIHPSLDDERVPRHFVELVVFHEMLHQVLPPSQGEDGRRCVHGREFRIAERSFPGYQRARAWEKAHLPLLLRSRG